jgi:hypothetical protein
MSAHRFEVTPVPEPNRNNSQVQPSEIIPLIHIENEIPPPPPLPASISSTNKKDTSRTSSKLFSAILQRKPLDTRRRATVAAALSTVNNQIKKSSSIDILNKPDSTNRTHLVTGNELEDSDVYSTTQSNNYDTNPLRITNKFLQEIRLKRRELREKSKNISIDQRIALHRRAKQRNILRAQDIFDVHFELNDDENDLPLSQSNFFTEESQEKIRNDIYKELNRQRIKQYHKHHRHLFLGRSLLMFMIALLAFMSLTLIYVVVDLYDRANYLDAKLPENEFIPMIYDKKANYY